MAELIGVVLRTKDRARTAAFYQALGIEGSEHRHGGPLHTELARCADNFVVELYAMSERFPTDAVMVRVGRCTDALATLARAGFDTSVGPVGEGFAYVRDPDGRMVMLMQDP